MATLKIFVLTEYRRETLTGIRWFSTFGPTLTKFTTHQSIISLNHNIFAASSLFKPTLQKQSQDIRLGKRGRHSCTGRSKKTKFNTWSMCFSRRTALYYQTSSSKLKLTRLSGESISLHNWNKRARSLRVESRAKRVWRKNHWQFCHKINLNASENQGQHN